MKSKEKSTANPTTPCPGCGGSGQTSYFAGESRFMLTREDCPDCAGTGVLLDDSDAGKPATAQDNNRQSSAKDQRLP